MTAINHQTAIIAGGGPAGLAAGYELLKRGSGINPVVFEASNTLGGGARNVEIDGLRLDIGGHRFFASIPRTQAWYNNHIEACNMHPIQRKASVYYKRKFTPYPLKMNFGTATQLGPKFALEASWGWIKNKLSREKRFIDEQFSKSFSNPLWQLDRKRFFADRETDRFLYPDKGPGEFWNYIAGQIESMGGFIEREARVTKIFFDPATRRFISTEVTNPWNETHIMPGDWLISTIPMREMVGMIEGIPVPDEVKAITEQLTHRRVFTVGMLIPRRVFQRFPPEGVQWVYIQDRSVQIGRVRILKNWSRGLMPGVADDMEWIAVDYFPDENSDLAYLSSEAMTELALEEFGRIARLPEGFAQKTVCARENYAYPVLNHVPRSQMLKVRNFFNHLPNVFVLGRNGQHSRYAMSHSTLSAIRAVDIIMSGSADLVSTRDILWDIDRSLGR